MNIEVYRIGAAAVEAMKLTNSGAVMGVTSRGAFLHVADRIIYLTPLDYRSPFNLTLAGGDHRFERLEPGDPFTVDPERIFFPTRQITVRTEQAEVWHPPQPAAIRSSLEEQLKRAQSIATRLRQIDAQKGYLFLSQPEEEKVASDQSKVTHAAKALIENYAKGNKDDFLRAAGLLIGSGGGLTPSGDDFLAGFMLYHIRRALSMGFPNAMLNEWCEELIAQSFQKTTTISANRLMFTVRGWSEDIFLSVIDHLFDPLIPFGDDLVHSLTEIGHSSGVDTFMGILYAIQSLQ